MIDTDSLVQLDAPAAGPPSENDSDTRPVRLVPTPAPGPDLSQWKIPPRAVPSHDCKIVIGRRARNDAPPGASPHWVITDEGETYYPHEGETVWCLPIGTTEAYLEMAEFEDLSISDVGIVGLRQLDEKLVDLCQALAKVIVAWDWTDNRRQPLPPPDADVLHGLEVDELLWLSSAVRGEVPSERKNDSAPSRAMRRAAARRQGK